MPKNKHIYNVDNDGYSDGYGKRFPGHPGFPANDGYTYTYQLNIRVSASDLEDINNINEEFFENEITNSTLGRILLRRGIKTYKNLK
jgi:hypothetical protein